jgi:hypothetical protein
LGTWHCQVGRPLKDHFKSNLRSDQERLSVC